MDERPTGLTFVFTDIEGSTQLVQDLQLSYGLALRVHRRIIQKCFEEHGGKHIGSEGDGLFFVFGAPPAAVAAAVAAQDKLEHYEWRDELRLRVRIGIHCGPVRVSDGEYLGLTIHEVARICAVAHGGQILCSLPIASAPGHSISGVSFRDIGTYQLRGIPSARGLLQVCAPGLEPDFPPPRDAIRDGGVRVTIWRREPAAATVKSAARTRPAGTKLVPRTSAIKPAAPTSPSPNPTISGVDGQALGSDIQVEVRPGSGSQADVFRVVVRRGDVVEEEYDGLTIGGVADAGEVVNAHSRLIRVLPASGILPAEPQT